MSIPGIQQRTVESFDGNVIAYQVRGDGPAVVLANGLGGGYSTWRHQYRLLGERYRVICWDYRGLYRSPRPVSLESLALPTQTHDLEAILRAERVERALFVGWSMGVQFNFEYYRRHAEQFVGLVALNGTAGDPFNSALGGVPAIARVLPYLVGAAGRVSPALKLATRAIVNLRGIVWLAKHLGLVGSTLDEQVFSDLTREFADLDFEAYLETFRLMGEHDAFDVLETVAVPALVITGSRDFMTPLATARAMVERLPCAELRVVEGGTHYTAVEFPDQVNGYLSDFIDRIDFS